MVGKRNFQIQFKGGQLKEMSTGSLTLVLVEEEVDKVGKYIIYDLPNKIEGGLLIIDGDTVFEECDIYGNGLCLYVFHCSFFMNGRTVGMFEEQYGEERDPNLEINEDVSICDYRGNHWKDILEDNIEYKGKSHVLRWDV